MAGKSKKEKGKIEEVDSEFDDGIIDELDEAAKDKQEKKKKKTVEDRLKELIEKGKKAGKLTSKELMEELESLEQQLAQAE